MSVIWFGIDRVAISKQITSVDVRRIDYTGQHDWRGGTLVVPALSTVSLGLGWRWPKSKNL